MSVSVNRQDPDIATVGLRQTGDVIAYVEVGDEPGELGSAPPGKLAHADRAESESEPTGEGAPKTQATTTTLVAQSTSPVQFGPQFPDTTATTSAPSTNPTVGSTSTPPPNTDSTSTITTPVGRRLVWSEEFNTLSTSRWSIEHSTYGDGNNELQCYNPNQVSVSGGSLVLRAEQRQLTCPNGSTRRYASGMVRSRDWTFSPGQSIEYRVKLTPSDSNNQSGLWPAVWSSSWAGSWPTGGEWDGLEVMTAEGANRSIYSIHYTKPDGRRGVKNKPYYHSELFSARWRTVRFDYGHNGNLVWYVDGKKAHEVKDAETIQGWPFPFDQTMKQLKLNLALGGKPGPLDDKALPATFKIDYVRVYAMS